MRAWSPALIAIGILCAGCRETATRPGEFIFDPSLPTLGRRAAKDAFLRDNPASPFNRPEKVPFAPLQYFPVDGSWVFQSRLFPSSAGTVVIPDTKGERREATVAGELVFTKEGREHRLRVYRMPGQLPGTFQHSIQFTDRTTGDSTYEVGRYLDFQLNDDPGHVYTIDFNLAYNPYCAYSPAYACPIPRPEDRLDLAVTAGEKKWLGRRN